MAFRRDRGVHAPKTFAATRSRRGGGDVAGVVLAVGDLAGDLPELGRDGALGGVHSLEAVEELVLLGATGGSTRAGLLRNRGARI